MKWRPTLQHFRNFLLLVNLVLLAVNGTMSAVAWHQLDAVTALRDALVIRYTINQACSSTPPWLHLH